jgi:hypothetical protein
MPVRIKNTEWNNFKKKFLEMLEVLGDETDRYEFPLDPENFEIFVDECEVHPSFTKKPEYLKVEYDFTLCNTKIRTLSFSIYKDAARIEMTLKADELKKDGKKIVWQESPY